MLRLQESKRRALSKEHLAVLQKICALLKDNAPFAIDPKVMREVLVRLSKWPTERRLQVLNFMCLMLTHPEVCLLIFVLSETRYIYTLFHHFCHCPGFTFVVFAILFSLSLSLSLSLFSAYISLILDTVSSVSHRALPSLVKVA